MASGSRKEGRWSLAGATVLVTGGSKGIGRAIVEELASFGASVHTCARNEAELRRCLEEWKAQNLAVTVSVCDVSVRADREALVRRVRSMFDGKLNILVNNAGMSFLKPALEVTPEECSRLMATNFEPCFHLSQLAHPLLKASGRGNIANVSSIASFLGYAATPIYSATKGAMNQVTKNLAAEWASDGIRVTASRRASSRLPFSLTSSVGASSYKWRSPAFQCGASASRRRSRRWWRSSACRPRRTSPAKSSPPTAAAFCRELRWT